MFLLIAIWNIPHTIGARYIISVGLLGLCMYLGKYISWKDFSWAQIIWAFYLLIFALFIAKDTEIAIKSFKSEWLKALLYIILGTLLARTLILQNFKKLLLIMALGGCVAPTIHIFQFFFKMYSTQASSLGYWGIFDHHALIGYATIQSCIILTGLISLKLLNKKENYWVILLLFICVLSPILARSRAGLIFNVLSIILTYSLIKKDTTQKNRYGTLALFILTIIAISTATILDPDRWTKLADRFQIGWQGDALQINCYGYESLLNSYRDDQGKINAKIEDAIHTLNSGDGSRIVTARAGLDLIKLNPLGIDGSKESYVKAFQNICSTPMIRMDHTHNGWIDSTLAIGIPGSALYFLLLCNYLWFGIKRLVAKDKETYYASSMLISLVIIWILRALLDSVQRDQMLEIQCFFMAFLYTRIKLRSSS